MIDLPHSLAGVATDWVSKVLADTPRFANDPVEGMDIEPLGDGIGQLSTCLLATTCVAIIGGANADPEKERSVELYRTLGQRNFSAIEDLDCLDVLNTIG